MRVMVVEGLVDLFLEVAGEAFGVGIAEHGPVVAVGGVDGGCCWQVGLPVVGVASDVAFGGGVEDCSSWPWLRVVVVDECTL